MNVSDLLSLGVSKAGLGANALVDSTSAVLSKREWLPRLGSEGELDHEAWEESWRTFSLAPGLFMRWYQPCFYAPICNGFFLSLEKSQNFIMDRVTMGVSLSQVLETSS